MAVDKESLLAAIAASGTQGKVDYEQAQVANRNAQAQAIQAALAGVAQNANPEAQAQLSSIVSQPYTVSNEHLAANEAAQQRWTDASGWEQGIFQGNIEKLREALIAQTLAEQAARAAGGGGGGGDGGGGGGGSDMGDWYDNLKDVFGTAAIGKQSIAAEARALGLDQWENSQMSPHEAIQKYAIEKYGVPEGTAAAWYPQSKEDQRAEQWIGQHAPKVTNRRQMKKFMGTVKKNNRATQGDQTYLRKQARQKAQANLQAQRRRRKRR